MTSAQIDTLVVNAQQGDRAAFKALVLELEDDLRIFLSSFQVTAGMVDEIQQAAFVLAYRKIHLYRPAGAFRAWIKTLARNLLFKELQEQRRFAPSQDDRLNQILVESAVEDIERGDEMADHVRRLRACLEKLAPPSRSLVEERYLAQQPLAALACQLQRTEIWVRVNLCRIRKVLRRCMEREGVEA